MATFPQAPVDLQVELDIASTWTSATSLSYQREGAQPAVTGTRGKPDESTQANPASAGVELNNRDGRFSPKNATGPYYGSLGRNTPLRMSVPAQANYLRLEVPQARAYVNDVTQLHITGSIEMRVQLQLTDWQGGILACKWDAGGCWYWQLNGNGTMTLGWFDGSAVFHSATSTAPVGYWHGSAALRVTLNASTGAVTFYTAASIDATYTQLGAVVNPTGGATSIQSLATSALQVGYSFSFTPGGILGRIAEYRLYNGIGGTVVADGVYSGQAAGTTTWTDSAGLTWLLGGGGEISGRDYRFHGECSALPPKWDTSGNDVSVPVTAAGVLRRIGQGQSPAQSPMRRALLAQSGTLACRAYWPCEDAKGATSFGSALGGPAMTFSQGSAPSLAADTSFLCSGSLPTLGSSSWQGPVPRYSGAGSIIVRFLLKLGSNLGSPPAAGWPLVRILTSGTSTNLDLVVFSGYAIGMQGGNVSGSVFASGGNNFSGAVPSGTLQGSTIWCSLELRPSGGTVDYALTVLYPGSTVGEQITGSYSGSIGTAQAVHVHAGALTDTVIGHVSVQSDWESLFNLYQPLNAWQGEAAGARIARLLGENSLSARIVGSSAVTAPMGPQGTATLSQLLQEGEDADRGILYDCRHQLAVSYRTYASLCSQAAAVTLDYSLGTLGGTGQAPEPTYDDQYIRNDMTVTRGSSGGGSAAQGTAFQYTLNDGSSMSTGAPPGGVGDYSDSLTANVQYDAMVPDVAGWMVHVGTVDEARWPAIPLNLARAVIQNSSLYYPLLGLDVGDYLEIINLPAWMTYDPVRQLCWGLKEKLGGIHHELEVNGVPEAPYEVMLLDDATYGHADTDGSTLAASLGSPLAAYFLPGGSLAGLTPANGTLAASQVPGQVPSGNWWALLTCSSSTNATIQGAAVTATPAEVLECSAVVYFPAGGVVNIGFSWQGAGGSTTTAVTVPAGVITAISSGAITAPGGTTGAIPRVGPVPSSATLQLYATALTAWQGAVSVATASGFPAWTQAAADFPFDIAIGGERITVTGISGSTSPQAFTVARAVNGVVKAQASGADVRLWHPPYLAIR